MTQRSTFLLVCCLAVSATTAYVPSTHKSQRRVADKINLDQPLAGSPAPSQPKSFNGRIRLDPVLGTNPLEKYQQQQQQQQQQQGEQEAVVDLLAEQQQEEAVVDLLAAEQQPRIEEPLAVAQEDSQLEQQQKKQRRQDLFMSGSAALAGFTDVLVLARYGCFVNMVTGSLLKMMTALANLQTMEAVAQASVVLSYMTGVTLFAKLKAKNADSDDNHNEPLRFVAPLVLALFASADLVTKHCLLSSSTTASMKLLQVPCLALGFGMVNSAAAHATGNTIFFAMTGHVTKVTHSLTGVAPADSAQSSRMIVRNFLGGALLAAVLVRQQVVLPLCTTLGLLYAGLYTWYAPLTGSEHFKQRVLPLQKAVFQAGQRIRRAFRRGTPVQMIPIPVPVLVEHHVMAANTNTNATYL